MLFCFAFFSAKKVKVPSLERTGTNTGAQFLRTIARILSSSYALWETSFEMIAETMSEVGCISHSRDSVLSGKTSKDTLNNSSVELEENF